MELGTGQAVFPVNGVRKLAICGETFAGKQALPETKPADRNVAQNHHGASAGSDLTDFFAVGILLQPQRGGCKNDPVL